MTPYIQSLIASIRRYPPGVDPTNIPPVLLRVVAAMHEIGIPHLSVRNFRLAHHRHMAMTVAHGRLVLSNALTVSQFDACCGTTVDGVDRWSDSQFSSQLTRQCVNTFKSQLGG